MPSTACTSRLHAAVPNLHSAQTDLWQIMIKRQHGQPLNETGLVL
jgi:hypothetical protein